MGEQTPKQFLLLKSRPILMYTLEAFFHHDPQIKIILVLPGNERGRWEKLCQEFGFSLPHLITKGGSNRTQSVWQGLSAIEEDEGLVAVHDGVRPLVDRKIIQKSYEIASKKGNAITGVALKDSIRWTDGSSNKALERNQYRLVQTPQTFNLRLLREAYTSLGGKEMTDDASVFEYAGHSIHMIEGSYRNIKITTPEDLKIAEALWEEPLLL
jgi:2-C-methyl-D-erythritol 4-phosphate cytidylyltransferase